MKNIFFEFFKSKRLIILIFTVALLIGSAGYFKYSSIPVSENDASLYKILGQEVASGSWITSETFGYLRTPGYPFILGAIYAIFGNNDLYIKFVQVLIFSIIAVIIFFIGDKLFNRLVGLFSAFWFITYYDFIAFSYLLMREIWIIFFILLSISFFIIYIKKQKIKYIIFGSLSFGYLIMVDPRYIFFTFILLGFTFFFSKKWSLKIRDLSIIILGILVFLIPWAIRQYSLYNRPILLTPVRDAEIFSFMKKSNSQASKEKNYYPFNMKREDYLKDLNASNLPLKKKKELEKQITDDYIRRMRSQIPQTRMKIYLHRLKDYWRLIRLKIGVGAETDVRLRFPWSSPKNLNNLIHIGFLLPFMFFGVFQIMKNRQLPQLLLIGFLTYHMIFHTLIHFIYRYRLPILPVLFLIGWYGVSQVSIRISKRRRIESYTT